MALQSNRPSFKTKEKSIKGVVSNVTSYSGVPEGYSDTGIIGRIPSRPGYTDLEIQGHPVVKKLRIDGNPNLEKGDGFVAYVNVIQEETEENDIVGGLITSLTRLPQGTYRSLEEKMSPFKIEKVVNERVVATYIVGA